MFVQLHANENLSISASKNFESHSAWRLESILMKWSSMKPIQKGTISKSLTHGQLILVNAMETASNWTWSWNHWRCLVARQHQKHFALHHTLIISS